MVRTLSLAAALAVLPLSVALAQDARSTTAEAKAEAAATAAEARIEAAAEAFEARMEAFGERAEALAENAALSEAQKETAMAALWAEYQPEVSAFTAEITAQAGAIAQAALADIDVEALVEDAMKSEEFKGAVDAANGMARNGAWAQDDPEQRVTYELIADYAMGEASEAVEEAFEADAAATLAQPE